MTAWKELSEAEYDAIVAATKIAIDEVAPQICKKNDDERAHGEDWPAFEKCVDSQQDDWEALMERVRKEVGGNLMRRNSARVVAFDVFRHALGWHGWAIEPWILLRVLLNMQERGERLKR